jgi:peptidoglycan LD-endopeptidase LytH
MKRRQPARPWLLVALLAAFTVGVLVDWALRTYGPPQPVDAPNVIAPARTPSQPGGSGGARKPETVPNETARQSATPTPTIGTSTLRLPIDGMNLESIRGSFYETRGNHRHEAVDILAPRSTPIHAVQNGTIAKLFLSDQGGITIYQFDPSGRLCYYYAHLQRYADNLREGDQVSQGQVLGYVGTSGNAPPNTPHLHFAVFELADDRRWWKGRPIDPYPLLTGQG